MEVSARAANAANDVWHTVQAPAKLNLFLHITGRREDGYHLLQSVMVRIGLFDILHFRLRHDKQIRLLNPQAGVPAEQDLVVRAAQALQHYASISQGVDILIHKHIPMGGGLGGGSSDAAVTLTALNQLWGARLSKSRLAELGLALGADIPFFVHDKPVAWVEGIGEKITALQAPLPMAYLLMHPPVHVSTVDVFRAPELRRNDQVYSQALYSEESTRLEGACLPGDNAMEATARELFPALDRYAQVFAGWAKKMGWPEPRMSGSGACFFIPLWAGQWDAPDRLAGVVEQAEVYFRHKAQLEAPRFWLVPQL